MMKIAFILLFVGAFAPPIFGQEPRAPLGEEALNISTLLREAIEKTGESLKRSRQRIADYTYKRRKTVRHIEKDGKIVVESETLEAYLPSNWQRMRKPKAVWVMIEKDGKPVSQEKVEKERLKAGRKLEKYERSADLFDNEPAGQNALHWGAFNIWKPGPLRRRGVRFDTQPILDSCQFHSPQREIVEEREMIALSFTKCSGAFTNEFTGGAADFDGVIWIDAVEKVFTRLAAWPSGMMFDDFGSDNLIKNAPMAVVYTRVKEGFWFWRFGRLDCDRLRNICKPIEDNLSIEQFDHTRFNVDAEKEKINTPEKK